MLHIDRHIAGFYQKIPDACRRVLHHQFPGGIVVLRAAVADACQQLVYLISQPSLGQRHVEHALPGLLLLHRRQGSAEPVQLVQIHRKADGTGAGGKFPHQQVVPPALQQGAGQGGQVTLKDQTIIVLHLSRKGHIQTDDPAQFPQRLFQRPQLCSGSGHCLVAAQRLHPGQDVRIAARKVQHPAEGPGSVLRQAGGKGGGAQLMGVLGTELFQQGGTGSGGDPQSIQQPEKIPHVADLQHPRTSQSRQRLRRQTHRLLHLRLLHHAQHLQTHLGDLLKGVALGGGAVDVFVVVVPQGAAGGRLSGLGNGKGHVRLQRQQPPVQVGKGNDLLRGKEAAVLLIQPILLKASHMILAAARRLVQPPQGKGGALLGLQCRKIKFHVAPPVPPSGPALPDRAALPPVMHIPLGADLRSLLLFYFILVKL